jgi:uncharacterized protein YndB with AHSA1/START domain
VKLEGRILHKETTVASALDRVWWAWATSDGLTSWWAKSAWIELRIGGPYELCFRPDLPRGQQGSEDCRILSYLPKEMLCFSWNFPPAFPTIRHEHTWIVLRFQREGPKTTRVIMDQVGWKDGPVWEAGWDYFDNAWASVLKLFKSRFSSADAPKKRVRG